jgi:hypothetical protein
VDAMPHTFMPFHDAWQLGWKVMRGEFGAGGCGYGYAVEKAVRLSCGAAN